MNYKYPYPTLSLGSPAGMATLLVTAAIYVYMAYGLYTIAKKTHTEHPWLAFVPLANVLYLFYMARVSLWWWLALLVPFANVAVVVWVLIRIAQMRRRQWWWGVLLFLNPVNLVAMYFMAFTEATEESAAANQTSHIDDNKKEQP